MPAWRSFLARARPDSKSGSVLVIGGAVAGWEGGGVVGVLSAARTVGGDLSGRRQRMMTVSNRAAVVLIGRPIVRATESRAQLGRLRGSWKAGGDGGSAFDRRLVSGWISD